MVTHMKKLNEARKKKNFKNVWTSGKKFYSRMGWEKLRYIIVNTV